MIRWTSTVATGSRDGQDWRYVVTMSGRPVVFLDRDGTLIEEVGYVNHPSRVRLLPGSAGAVARLRDAGFVVVVVTNKAGIARGYLPRALVDAAHAELARQLAAHGTEVDAIYLCPHHPTEGVGELRMACECRKPGPGLLRQAADDLDLDLARAAIVGDLPSDLAAGAAIGARTVLVLTGLGRGEWEYRRERFAVAPDHVCADLAAAVEWLLEDAPAPRLGAAAC
jgi:D-glycero-D-manno-heptose 1,7-bisphosphate phosphatase